MKRPALGHLLGYTALTVMLTAGAAQSLSGSNTVFTDDIASGNVFNSDLATNAVTGAKVYPNSVTGADVNEKSLVPTCVGSLLRAGDVCYTVIRLGADDETWFNAALHCRQLGLRLPTVSEAFFIQSGAPGTSGIWTDVRYADGAMQLATVVDSLGATPGLAGNELPFRCVTTVGARP